MHLYKPMLKTAFQISWKHKYLWFFGLFAVMAGNGGAFNLGLKNIKRVESHGIWLADFKEAVFNWHFKLIGINWSETLNVVDIWGILLFLVMVALGVFFLWLAISSQGALVYGIKGSLNGNTGIFNEAMKRGTKKFWPILLLNIVLNVSIYLVWILISLPFLILFISSRDSILWQNILIALSFIVLVPLAVILSLIVRYAVIYIVNEDKHIGDAIVKAWRLFKENWIISIETGFLLFILNIVTGLLLIVAGVLLALPFVLLGLLAASISSSGFMVLVATVAVLSFIAMVFLYAALWNVFQVTVWIILFDKISRERVYSKLHRWGDWLTKGINSR